MKLQQSSTCLFANTHTHMYTHTHTHTHTSDDSKKASGMVSLEWFKAHIVCQDTSIQQLFFARTRWIAGHFVSASRNGRQACEVNRVPNLPECTHVRVRVRVRVCVCACACARGVVACRCVQALGRSKQHVLYQELVVNGDAEEAVVTQWAHTNVMNGR